MIDESMSDIPFRILLRKYVLQACMAVDCLWMIVSLDKCMIVHCVIG